MFSLLIRFAFFICLCLISIHIFVFLSLNIPMVQNVVLDFANKNYLSHYGATLSYDAIGVSFFPAGLTLTGASVSQTGQNSPNKENWLHIDEVTVGPDISSLGIFRGQLLDSVIISGVKITLYQDENGLINPIKSSDTADSEFKPEYILEIRRQLPGKVTIQNIDVTLIDKRNGQRHIFLSDELTIHNERSIVQKKPLQISLRESRWSGMIAGAPHTITASGDTAIQDDMTLVFNQWQMGGSFGDAHINAKVVNFESEKKSNAQLKRLTYPRWNAKGSVQLKLANVLNLAGLKALGEAKLENFEIQSKGLNTESLKASATVSWKNAQLEGFQLYSGKSRLKLESGVLNLADVNILTPLGAKIATEGFFEFRKQFSFSLNAKIQDFYFTELMSGLGAPTEAVSFKVNTELANVEGTLFPFTLKVKSPKLKVNEFFVPSIPGTKKFSFPLCESSLNLYSDTEHLDLKDTQISCGNTDHMLTVKSGSVVYAQGKTLFELESLNTNVAWLSGFMNHPSGGRAHIRGKLTGSHQSQLEFVSQIEAHQLKLYNVLLKRLETNMRIDEKGIVLQGASAHFNASEEALAKIDLFSLNFASLKSEIVAHILNTPFSALKESLGEWIPKDTPIPNGLIAHMNFRQEGPLQEWAHWHAQANGQIDSINWLESKYGTLLFDIDYKNKSFKNSKILIRHPLGGSLAIQTRELSQNHGEFVCEINKYLLDFPQIRFKSELTGKLRLSNGWSNPVVVTNLLLDRSLLNDQDLAPIVIHGSRMIQKSFDLTFTSQFSQLTGRLSMPLPWQISQKNTSGVLFFNDFDAFYFLPPDLRKIHNLSTQISGEFSLSLTDLKSFDSKFDGMNIQGNLKKIFVSSSNEHLRNKAEVKLSIVDSKLSVSETTLQSEHLKVFIPKIDTHLSDDEFDTKINVTMGLGLLKQFSQEVTQADGTIESDIMLSGPMKNMNIWAAGKVENSSLALRATQPGFFNLRGRFIYKNKIFRILTLRGRKGNGTLEVAGSIDWNTQGPQSDNFPDLSFQIKSDNTQWRVAVPLLTSFDSDIDADVELSGKAPPYLLSGRLAFKRAVGFRDANCQEIATSAAQLAKGPKSVQPTSGTKETENLQFNLEIHAPGTVNIQTACLRSKLRADLNLKGTPSQFIMEGEIRSDSGTLTYQKTRFDIVRALLSFDNPVRIDPKIDAELMAQIEAYQLHLNLDGTALSLRPSLWSDPSTGPSGENLNTQDLISMISRGAPPRRQDSGSSTGTSKGVTGSLLSLLTNSFDDPLSQTFSKITGGFIDDVQLQPDSTGNLKARISRSLGERLNLSLDLDPTSVNSSQSLRGIWSLSDTINVLGGFDRKSSDTGTTLHEYSGDLRFQFGGSK